MNNMGWKTLTGCLLVVIGTLSEPEILAVLPEKVAQVVVAIGAVLAVFGLRHAQAKTIAAVQPNVVVAIKDQITDLIKKSPDDGDAS